MTLAEARILVVDDEEVLRNLFAKWLIRSGCTTVMTAENGRDAIERVQEHAVDLLITDIRMPVMDGITLVRTLHEIGVAVPCIVFVTGVVDIDYREMHGLGVEAFLGKPFHMEDLSAALRGAISERDVLWSAPMSMSPRTTICIPPGPRIGTSGETTFESAGFHLGRGGFSMQVEDAPATGRVSFDLDFTAEPRLDGYSPHLCGQGLVRWRCRNDHRVGIEFAYLESPGRQWVVDRIKTQRPHAFIPR